MSFIGKFITFFKKASTNLNIKITQVNLLHDFIKTFFTRGDLFFITEHSEKILHNIKFYRVDEHNVVLIKDMTERTDDSFTFSTRTTTHFNKEIVGDPCTKRMVESGRYTLYKVNDNKIIHFNPLGEFNLLIFDQLESYCVKRVRNNYHNYHLIILFTPLSHSKSYNKHALMSQIPLHVFLEYVIPFIVEHEILPREKVITVNSVLCVMERKTREIKNLLM